MGGFGSAYCLWPSAQADAGATCGHPLAAGSWGDRLWLSGRTVDDKAGGSGDREGVWRSLSSRPRQSPPAVGGLEPPAAHPTSHPARRRSCSQVAGGALARPQKGAEEEGRTVVWVDESGFYLLPSRIRTYAPRKQTPILRVKLTHDHLSAISAITPAGRLLLLVEEHALRGPDVVRFLRHLLRHIAGKLLVIWDGSPIHRSRAVKDFLAAGGAKRIHLEQLPGYAPDLNPDEGIWNYLKRVELRNVCSKDLPDLRQELRLATARLRHKHHIIQGCFRQAGYYD